ncbi:DUF4352 domain-containing protein [Sphingobacteriales bacterium UPWRP_1]|nr:hypothetical protein BVG80_05995 [Sphingobacteriales bacterium TSM_CSM]PSJ76754.1 DUF4352 domain-containing protein [Sphingobacteriales bacterium UPWRP_1]
MQALYFLATILTILILVIRILVKLIRKRPILKTIKVILYFFIIYILLWGIFYFKAKNQTVPLATDICFDDWCATVTSFEKAEKIGNQVPSGQFIILTIKMTNKAKGIAQKPSEPRVHIIDDNSHIWSASVAGQKALENVQGHLLPIDQRLELHQSLETKIVFDVSKNAKSLNALIEEGPFITKLLLRDDNKIFKIQ